MQLRALWVAVSSAATVGCGAMQLYDGPRLPTESVAVIAAPASRASIERIDGREVHVSEVEVLPGDHEIEFAWSMPTAAGSLFPAMETACYFKTTLAAARRYSFEENLTREAIGLRPPQTLRWTLYRVDPKLRDETTGESIGEPICNPTCRAHGKNGSTETNTSCRDILEPRVVGTLDEDEESGRSRSPEKTALSKIIFDRLSESCAEQRSTKDLSCLSRRLPNNLTYLAGDGTLVVFYPSEETNLRPGLRDEARSECLGDPHRVDIPQCLNGYGWVHLP